ncbi:MAG: hypothetical protein H7226_10400 [Salinibacterium sp.]|nr:hypothetical protein [Salinibacterium sp.]
MVAGTYYEARRMYRLANMIDVAHQVGADDIAFEVCTTRDERCFVDDEEARGIVGPLPTSPQRPTTVTSAATRSRPS